jgi:pimeloyl-ACP methyl ester carboxylesterase
VPDSEPQPPRRRDITVAPELRLRVVEWGAPGGPPIVFLHGGAHDSSAWSEVCRRLPQRYRCIVPDQRGHGASEQAPDGDYSCEAQTEDLASLLDALAIERCALVGHSMGGLNALRFAGLRPARATALVLVDVSTDTREAGMKAIERSRERSAPHDPAAPPPPFDLRLLDFVATYGGDAAERRALLAASHAPLLVLRGAKSRILSAEGAEGAARLGGGRVIEIPNAGHDVASHNPGAVAAALALFLDPLL